MPFYRLETKRTKSFQLVPKLKLIFMWISLASGLAQVQKFHMQCKPREYTVYHAIDKVSLFYSMFGLRSQLP